MVSRLVVSAGVEGNSPGFTPDVSVGSKNSGMLLFVTITPILEH